MHDTARRIPPYGYLLVAVAATAANLALWTAGVQYTIATGMLVGAACAGVVCWRHALAEERVAARIDRLSAAAAEQPVPWAPGRSPWPVRRSAVVRDGRLALVEPTTTEAAELRRLVEVHLRDQLDAEMKSKVEDALVEGFTIGYRARDAEGRGGSEGGESTP